MSTGQVETMEFDAYYKFMNWARPRGYTQNITPSGYTKWNDGTTKAMVTPSNPQHRRLMFSTPVIVTFAPIHSNLAG